MDLQFKVEKQQLSRTDNQMVVGDSKNYLSAVFSFSSEWSGLIKTAQFTRDRITYDMLLVSDRCLVPWEVLVGTGSFTVNVFAGDLITVNPTLVHVNRSGLKTGQLPSEPTPGYFKQVMDTLIKPGPQGEPGPQGDPGPAGEKGDPGTTTWAGITDKPDDLVELSDNTAWTNATLSSGWTNYSETYNPVGYMKDALGFVHLQGMTKEGQIGDYNIFALPEGYRPPKEIYLGVLCYNNTTPAIGRLVIFQNGNVRLAAGYNVLVCLESIIFKV